MEKLEEAKNKTDTKWSLFKAHNVTNTFCMRSLKAIARSDKFSGTTVDRLLVSFAKCVRDGCFMDKVETVLLQRKHFIGGESKACKKWNV